MKKNKTSDSYEKLFIELENIVEKMDSGSISLERSLELFEKGMDLIKEGKNKLDEAEIKVKTIMKASDDQILKE
tara:strand:- start:216 stop:437 length:222 start_codon:yes stop_codon:yes gene_type:complete